ncbi:hypothetical protein FQY83_17455 [Luteimonas marina]|uniref:Uncharacterized protein n=1 Tax=Luteimonas marina TaxID=488485 RepID=A0A5C5TSX0_9GAMM|nr:hypothetical protein [Luteimonas marina]TWT17094.1 hypothetical protein FQY83_17455 [Luteimonas marina]
MSVYETLGGPNNFSALIVLALAALGSSEQLPTVPDKELSIAGIALDADEASVLRTLGQPVRVTDTGDFLNIQLDYPGLTIWLGEGRRVGEILSTSPEHCTPGGICPGMAFSQVQAMYGPPSVATREDGQFMEYFPMSDFPCWLQLAVADGVVKSVRAECQP